MEKTKILKQESDQHTLKMRMIGGTNFIIAQNSDVIVIDKKHLPEFIELLKSEMEVNNG